MSGCAGGRISRHTPRRSRVAGGFDVRTQARSSGDPADQGPSAPPSPCSRWLAILPRGRKIPDRRFDSDRVLGGRMGGKLVIGEKGVVNAIVETVDAIILGHYDGNM